MFIFEPYKNTNEDINKLCERIYWPESQNLLYVSHQQKTINLLFQMKDIYMIRQYSKNQTIEIKFKDEKNGLKKRKINGLITLDNQFIIVCENPFKIYFIGSQQDNLIELTTEKQIQLQEIHTCINYPYIYIYGRNQQNKTNQILQVNLQTLNVKTIHNGKGYAPGYRKQFITIFHRLRLYIFGGHTDNGECDKLVWVHDFQSGNMFAQQMQYPNTIRSSNIRYHPIKSGQILITDQKQQKMWVFEVHQSKITQILQQKYKYKGYNLWLEDMDCVVNVDNIERRCKIWNDRIIFCRNKQNI